LYLEREDFMKKKGSILIIKLLIISTFLLIQDTAYPIYFGEGKISQTQPEFASGRLIVKLKPKSTSAPFTFTLIVVHTDPNPTAALSRDLNALARIYQTVQTNDQQDDDVILLGDLNTDPSDFQGLGNIPDLVYAVPDTGTMVQGAKRNDNIVFQWGSTGEDYTGRAGILRLVEFLGISKQEAESLSDHEPVYAVFFTRRDTR